MGVQKTGFCSLCTSQCAAIYTIEDDRLVAVEPRADHPTGGAMCLKGKAAPEIIYNSDRILTPLERTTPKSSPDPGWRPISWAEAIAKIAAELGRLRASYGAESVAFATTTPTGTGLMDSIEWIDRLVRVFGSPNKISTVELCDFHKEFAHRFTFGEGIPYPDYARADTILFWGFNPTSTWLNSSQKAAEAKARGSRMVVVDPRPAGFAREASRWLRIRPGADGVLAMGVAHLLLEWEAYNEPFVRRWTNSTLLVRQDNGQLLRWSDLSAGSDEPDVYVAWDEAASAFCRYRALTRTFSSSTDDLMLTGTVEVLTLSGFVTCKPAFQVYKDAAAEFTVERTAELTWLAGDDILAFAQDIASAKTLAYYVWTGVSQHAHATQIDRAIALLMALKGCYDAPGGNVLQAKPRYNPVGTLDLLPPGQLEKTVGLADLPLGPPKYGMVTAQHFYRAVLEKVPYAIRGLVSFGANMAVAHAGPMRAREALQKLDFYVHCDMFENPTARYADIFLPVNTLWEHEGLRIGFAASQDAEEMIQLRQQMVAPLGDSRSDVEVCFALGKALGHDAEFFSGDIDAGYNHMLAPTSTTVAELRATPEGIRKPLKPQFQKYKLRHGKGYEGFPTETGLIEVYSELLKRHRQPPVPMFDEADLPGGEMRPEFPFALTTAKSGYFCHSQHRNVRSLRSREPDPVVELSPTAADSLALIDGDWVYVETDVGRVRMRLRLNDSLHDRVARGSYGWWQANGELKLSGFDPFAETGSNYNMLIDAGRVDPVSGTPGYRSASCRISSIDAPARSIPAWRGFRETKVIGLRNVTADVREIVLAPLGDGPLPDFKPGQRLTLRVNAPDRSELVRCYSLTSSAVDPTRSSYTIAVRRQRAPPDSDHPPGRMSNVIHDVLALGDVIGLKAPGGTFHFPLQSDRPLIFLAGGIGITPFYGYLRTAAALGVSPRVHLVYANRNRASHSFDEELDALRALLPQLTIVNVYSRPNQDDQLPPGARTGRIKIEDILIDDLKDKTPLIFQCASSEMMSTLRKALVEHGVPDGDIHEEAFAAPVGTVALPEGPFEVTFARSGKTVVWTTKSGTLLDLGEANGMPLKSGCRVGQCESCAVTVRSGSFIYRTKLNADDVHTCLLCQAVPTGALVLDA
jgi:anaerobic selenocysteine-containing dehydrogenase/ferredoxin-NADP reductase